MNPPAALQPFAPLWQAHAPAIASDLLTLPARQAFDALAPRAPAGTAGFALECGLTPGVRPHLYLALQDPAAKAAAGHAGAPGLLYLRYTLNRHGQASVPLPCQDVRAGAPQWPALIEGLRAQGLPAAQAGQARLWLDGLPAGAAIDCAAWLDRRPGQPLRLFVSGLPQGQAPAGLPQSGPADLPPAAQALGMLASRCVAIVDLDAAGPRPRWGLELLAERHPQGTMARWTPLLDGLQARQLCSRAARTALARWCADEPARGISHLKLMIEGQRVLDARVFLRVRA
ncbi:hypothetical protein V8Z80_06610 [Orrella sp. JC864]|uniref:hypothetical protein n=1 Tax=Orrella sp. JC864 TaxID=3120298 RepID=UPI00300A72DC